MARVSSEGAPRRLAWDSVPSVHDDGPCGPERFFTNGLLGPTIAELAKSANGQAVEESVGPLLRGGNWLEFHVSYDPESGGVIKGSVSYFSHDDGVLSSSRQCQYDIEAGVVINSLYRRLRTDGSVIQALRCNYNPANGQRVDESDMYFRADGSPQQETYTEFTPEGQTLKSVIRTLLPDGTIYQERLLYPLAHHKGRRGH